MRRLFVVLLLLVAGVAALGYYRGWYTLDWEKTGNQGQLTGTVNEDKFEADKKQALEKVKGLGDTKANAGTATKE
jgi:hypothetical protein